MGAALCAGGGKETVDEAVVVDPDGLVAAAAAGLVATGGDGLEGGEVVAGDWIVANIRIWPEPSLRVIMAVTAISDEVFS